MKKLLTGLFLVASLFLANAATDSGAITITTGANQITNVLTSGALVDTIEIYNGTSVAINYGVIDAPGQSPIFTNVTYSSVSQFLSNLTVLSTNFFGHIYTNTVSNVLFTVTNTTVGSSNNPHRVIASGVLASSNTASLEIPGGWVFAQGVMITNSLSTNNTFRIVYNPLL